MTCGDGWRAWLFTHIARIRPTLAVTTATATPQRGCRRPRSCASPARDHTNTRTPPRHACSRAAAIATTGAAAAVNGAETEAAAVRAMTAAAAATEVCRAAAAARGARDAAGALAVAEEEAEAARRVEGARAREEGTEERRRLRKEEITSNVLSSSSDRSSLCPCVQHKGGCGGVSRSLHAVGPCRDVR